MRRFASETLRLVCENRWMYGEPEYSLSALRLLFREKSPYPRTSVGNNLSDLARKLPGLVYELVAELVSSGDKNSKWIATRACRNLVKSVFSTSRSLTPLSGSGNVLRGLSIGTQSPHAASLPRPQAREKESAHEHHRSRPFD